MAEKGSYTYDYPRPMLTVDAVVFSMRGGHQHLLLIQRGNPPFEGAWALPGGFVEIDESLETAAARELAEETCLTGIILRQFRTFGDPGRDPRGRSISVAFVGDASPEAAISAGDDAAGAGWFSVDDLPQLAFDHAAIVEYALESVKQEECPCK